MKLIQRHLNNIASELGKSVEKSSISKNAGNIGSAREALISDFLSSNLPSNLDITSGEIFDSNDSVSAQIDIIVHTKESIKLKIENNIKLIPVDNVLALIECKSNLTTGSMISGSSHLKSALDSCVRSKKLKRINPIGLDANYMNVKGIPGNSIQLLERISGMCATITNTPSLIFAFKGPTEDVLRKSIFSYMEEKKEPLDYMPNVITVLDKGYYMIKNDGFLVKKLPNDIHYSTGKSENSVLMGMYMYLVKLSEAQKMSGNFFPIVSYL